MTVAIACNLSDGVILGVDSATTVPTGSGVPKVFDDGEKRFQLAARPTGVATYGLGALGTRTIGSYLREFDVCDPGGILIGPGNVADIVEAMRVFFYEHYRTQIITPVEAATGKKFAELPPENRPLLGLIVGGFSNNAYLSEVWEIQVPVHDQPNSAIQRRRQGDFGVNWFAMAGPINRYLMGYDIGVVDQLAAQFTAWRGSPLSPAEVSQCQAILTRGQYEIPFNGMPMKRGVEFTRFLVELVINHHRFAAGQEWVGGRATIGMVTYGGDRFRILD